MEGRPYEELHEFCDFSLAEQNEAVASKGVPPSAPSDFVPVLKKNVCYIVAAVIFNENNEVRITGAHSSRNLFCQLSGSDDAGGQVLLCRPVVPASRQDGGW